MLRLCASRNERLAIIAKLFLPAGHVRRLILDDRVRDTCLRAKVSASHLRDQFLFRVRRRARRRRPGLWIERVRSCVMLSRASRFSCTVLCVSSCRGVALYSSAETMRFRGGIVTRSVMLLLSNGL
jgi:hypothetical protein